MSRPRDTAGVRPDAPSIGRVVLVNDYRSLGGAERVVADTAELLEGAGIAAHVFSSEDVPGHRRNAVNFVHHRAARTALARLVNEVEPDVVHLHNVYHELSPAVLSVPARLGVPSLVTAHDWHLACPNPSGCRHVDGQMRPVDLTHLSARSLVTSRWDVSRVRSLARLVQHVAGYRIVDRRSDLDLIVCPSPAQAAVFERSFGATAAVLRNPQPAPPTEGAPSDRSGFVFAGRVEPEKGLAAFIEVAPVELLDDLRVIGEGEDLERCRAAAQRRGAATEFTGRLSAAETLDAMRRCDVLVLPSRWPEIAPLAVIEAIASGCRVLGSRLGGIPELCAGRDELLFDPFDEDDVARACRAALAADPSGPRPEASARAQTRETYLAELVDLYATAVATHRRRAAAGR
ncbi:MAG: glycosyltransferase [Ilumatobacter sp.]|uniref:glycosyltransferase n=1 Tax=Ilumatobacter sp. TaxID=1967498 RepID=UPI00262E7118|nr:glycosyltransferase [Ilumatobacter sp.]MDJ0771452.1 glycosyltransferase [Ilumatobacter sp.]